MKNLRHALTDKDRLDFLQLLSIRAENSVEFNGSVKRVRVDAELHVADGKFYVMLRDKFGHGDSGAFDRSAKTVRKAIDKAIRFHLAPKAKK